MSKNEQTQRGQVVPAGDGARTGPSAGRLLHTVARGMRHSWDPRPARR